MLLTSFSFWLFLAITLIIYFIVPKKMQWVILLISSLVFLFYDNFHLSTVLQALFILLITYIGSQKIYEYQGTKKSKVYLLLSTLTILGLLVYLKYSNLFLVIFNHFCNLVHINHHFGMVYHNTLVGISYFSLIMISYLLDIYHGAHKPQKNIFKLALFMSYFPILTTGPFIRYENVNDELYDKHKFNYHNLCMGLLRIAWGLFKVLVISQRIAIFVDGVYGNYMQFNGFYIVLAAMFFVIQLYTNFSGSIDIIMGVSEIMGITLPENFQAPFFSKTITEFWRRWHITLGTFLKDYIFYPLMKSDFMQGLNRKAQKFLSKKQAKKIPLYFSMLIMWILIGIWHGGAFTYIIGSGLLQFIFIFLEDILTPVSQKINKRLGINTETFGYKLYQVIRTFMLFSFAMIFFRANSLKEAFGIIQNIFVWNPWILLDNTSLYLVGLDMLDFRVLIIALIVLFGVDYLSLKMNVREKLFAQNIVFRWTVIYLLLFAIIIFGCYGEGFNPATFIYRQF